MRAELRVGVDIAAPAQLVWDVVTSWERQGEWIPFTRVRRLPGPHGTVGEHVLARTALGPLGFDDPMTVTAWEPPSRCLVEHTGRVVRGSGEFGVQPQGAGSRFTWSEVVSVPGGRLAPLLWRIAAPPLRLGFGVALRRLKRVVENEDR